MRDPVHRVKPKKPRAVPVTPRDRTRLGTSHRRLHQRPAAQDDENADGVETQSRNLKPNRSQNSQRAGCNVAPVGWRKNAMLEIGSEKMKVCDEKNCQPLGDVD